ncbi:hypothetical protein OIU85_001114 [Salix viminalis]|uniref:Uncharacterized protein n=1 Tax=Salix viminalis TaxID=40686 RepID=A0A9Q0VKK5_SALVM|nr:hypothetical protein OIU85_001114 [Salix viminalis]
MDGAEARDLYRPSGAKRQSPMSRRARRSLQNQGREQAGDVGRRSWWQGKSAKWIRNLGEKGLALRAGLGGPSPEPVGCRWDCSSCSTARRVVSDAGRETD